MIYAVFVGLCLLVFLLKLQATLRVSSQKSNAQPRSRVLKKIGEGYFSHCEYRKELPECGGRKVTEIYFYFKSPILLRGDVKVFFPRGTFILVFRLDGAYSIISGESSEKVKI